MPHPLIHGIDTYFAEFTANRRRVAATLLAVSAALSLAFVTVGRRVTTELLDDPKRFGFEGPQQWVERIQLEQMAAAESPGVFAVTYLTAESRKGSRKQERLSHHPHQRHVIVHDQDFLRRRLAHNGRLRQTSARFKLFRWTPR